MNGQDVRTAMSCLLPGGGHLLAALACRVHIGEAVRVGVDDLEGSLLAGLDDLPASAGPMPLIMPLARYFSQLHV